MSRHRMNLWFGAACCIAGTTLPLYSQASTASTNAAGVEVLTGADWVSAPVQPTTLTVDMRTLSRVPEWRPGDPIIEIPRQFSGDPDAPVPVPANPVFGDDLLALQQRNFAQRSNRAFGTPVQNFNAIASTAVSPNDPTGDIGTLQFVAAINGSGGGLFAVYNKNTAAQIAGPTAIETLGAGGPCASGLGDPIVLFDELANRWVITEFTASSDNLCVYISSTADLSGVVTWTRYVFLPPDFPDYPKYGLWPDAYYVGANESGTANARPFYAMNRTAMLAGIAATMQRVTIPNLAAFGFQMTQPADLSGSTPPPVGAPGIFMRHNDDEAHSAGSNNATADFLQMFEFRVDFVTPANTSVTGPISFQMPEFSSDLNGFTAFQAFPQSNGTRLDPLRETVMHRLAYRRLPGYEVLFGNLVTDLFLGAGSTFPNDTGGVRWFEMRRTAAAPPELFADGFEDPVVATGQWVLHQAGTFAPPDGTPAEQSDRWMAGSNIDASGNIGLAYNVVRQSPAIATSVRYTGRLAGDPIGVMTQTEVTAVTGSGTTSNRWGDYNDMGVDPVDGCTFWFIGNYVLSSQRANRITAFRHDDCVTPTFALTPVPAAAQVCAMVPTPTNATAVTLNVTSVNGFAQPVALSFPAFPTGVAGIATPPTVPTLPGSSIIQLTATSAATPGVANIAVRGNSGAQQQETTVALNIVTVQPAVPTLTAPANAATGVSRTPTFTWGAVPQTTQYLIEASTSNTFVTTLVSQTVTATSLLSPVTLPAGTQIFWRVRGVNTCGNGTFSTVFSFTTL